MNKIFLIGNLTRDPELTQNNQGVSICRFRIAVNRPYPNKNGERETDYFNCSAWRGTADAIGRYCQKGNKVAVTGHIQFRNYEDNDGIKRTDADVIVQDVEFLSPRNQDGNSANGARKPTLQSFDDDGDIPF